MEKKFLPYLTTEVLKKDSYWIVLFSSVDPINGQSRPIAGDELAKISNDELRIRAIDELVSSLNEMLPNGIRYVKQRVNVYGEKPLSEAIAFAHEVKCRTDRKRTRQMYDSVYNVFGYFLTERDYWEVQVQNFTTRHAMEFMDYLITDRRVGGRTYNNYLVRMKALFNALLEREWITKNPFNGVKKRKEVKKLRRNLEKEERKLLANYIREHDYWLFISIILEYHCFIRPNELRFLRFKMFNLSKGVIRIPAEFSKNGKDRNVTIPLVDMEYFLDRRFNRYPGNFYVFGSGGKRPHPEKPIGINTLRTRHNKIVKKLGALGKLHEIKGIKYYSWKDSGITDALKSGVVLPEVQSQADHWSPQQTMQYYHNGEINEGMKRIETRIDE